MAEQMRLGPMSAEVSKALTAFWWLAKKYPATLETRWHFMDVDQASPLIIDLGWMKLKDSYSDVCVSALGWRVLSAGVWDEGAKP